MLASAAIAHVWHHSERMTAPNRPPGGGAPGRPWTPAPAPSGVTCPTCGLRNEPGARVCRNCGLPVAADNDPLRGVSPGSVEMPSTKRAGFSATIGLGLVVVLLLVAGSLAVSGGGILNSGGRIGVAAEPSPSPSAGAQDGIDPETGERIVTDGTGNVGDGTAVAQAAGTETDFICTSGAIRDPDRGKWTISAPTPSKPGEADRLTFKLSQRGKSKASEGAVVRLDWMSPREAREAFGLTRVGGTRALVLTFEGNANIKRNSRLETAQLEGADADALRTVDTFDTFDGGDGDVRAVIGFECWGQLRRAWARHHPPIKPRSNAHEARHYPGRDARRRADRHPP